ncbi:glycosyltransferase [Paenibacillus sp. S-38]|uniref:glycosyltransferase n=1 Tax=Paenibacillus sp. S-38 TaxID=3416710 RepID=UPI003CEB1A1A
MEKLLPGQSKVQLAFTLRKLWMEHLFWTRTYIVSAVDGLADRDKVLARLLKNQQDLGDAIKPYYGEAAGNKLAELLREHILIAGKIVEAAKQANGAELDRLNKEWYRNADDIAQFLSSANPHWKKAELKAMMERHLQLVADALQARLKQDWDADIRAFDQGEAHLLHLADTLAQGIIKQFPKKFQ